MAWLRDVRGSENANKVLSGEEGEEHVRIRENVLRSSLHLAGWPSQKQTNNRQSTGDNVEKTECLHTAGGNAK